MSLSSTEKDELLKVIEILFGHDPEIERSRASFNKRTVETVEEALTALVRCNSNMRSLVVSLIGGGGLLVKGWLREILSRLRKELESQRIRFDGLGCKVVVTYNWKSAVILTTK